MKKLKLAALVSAFAVAFSAFADTAWFDGKIETGWPSVAGMNGAWCNNATDLATFQAAVADPVTPARLELDAGDSVLDFTATTAKNLASDAESVTYTTTVQFYPFSAAPATVDADAKAGAIVVTDSLQGDCLYVLAKKSDADENEWVKVMTGEDPVSVSTSLAYTLAVTIAPKAGAENTLTVTYTLKDGALQAPVSKTYDVYSASKTTSKACYSGSGYIESLAATYAPGKVEFTVAAPDHATVSAVTNGTEGLTAPYKVYAGTTVEVTYNADAGYFFANGQTSMSANITVDAAGEQPAPQGTDALIGVAKIGDDVYATLGAAITALNAGAGNVTLTIQRNYDLVANDKILISKNATVDLGGFTLSMDGSLITGSKGIGVAAGAEVTFQNGTIAIGTGATTGSNYGMAVCGTVNVNCTMTRAGASAPMFDLFDGTLNVGATAQLTSAGDVFRFKKDDTAASASATVTVADGAKVTVTDTSMSMFYNYKANSTANITINGGEFTKPVGSSWGFFGSSSSGDIATWNVTIDSKAKFNTNNVFVKTVAESKIIPGKVVQKGADPDTWYYVVPATYTITVDANGGTGGSASPVNYQYSNEAVEVTLTKPTAPSNKEFDSWTVSGVTATVTNDKFEIPAKSAANVTVKANWKAVQTGFSVTITFAPATGITGYTVEIDGGTASEKYTGNQTFNNISTKIQINPALADWYKAQYNGADGTGLYTEAATVTLTAAATQSSDISGASTAAEVAEKAGVSETTLNNLCPGGAKASLEVKKAKMTKAMNWAKANDLGTSDIAELNFETPDQKTEAYLLGTAVDAGAISAAKAAFKFPSIAPGTIPTAGGTDNFNGTVTVKGSNDLQTWGAAEATHKFYKAELTK